MPADSRGRGPEAVTLEPDHTAPVVVALGEASLTHDLLVLRAASAERLVRGEGSLIVDVTSLRRLSSETVAALLWARRKCRAHGLGFAITGARTGPARTLYRCGLDEAVGAGER